MATAEQDYYELLGVSRDASHAEIKRAFRRLARELHPDVSEDPDAGPRFRAVAEAYEVLADPERRQLYDRFGQAGVRGGGFAPMTDFGSLSDVFAAFFGETLFGTQGQATRGPMATRLKLSGWDPDHTGTPYGMLPAEEADTSDEGGGGRGGFGGFGAGGQRGPTSVAGLTADPNAKTRVVLKFPAKADDMLLSGTLEGGNTLESRAQLVDESIGKGHVVMFAIRPFWRWQTQGTFAMGFNAIMNWNDLSAGNGPGTSAAAGQK